MRRTSYDTRWCNRSSRRMRKVGSGSSADSISGGGCQAPGFAWACKPTKSKACPRKAVGMAPQPVKSATLFSVAPNDNAVRDPLTALLDQAEVSLVFFVLCDAVVH